MQHSASARRIVLVAFLLVAVLFAQSLGLMHAIIHAGWESTTPSALEALFDDAEDVSARPVHDYNDGGADAKIQKHNHRDISIDDAKGQHVHGHHHSCIDYDAVTLAGSMVATLPSLPLLPGTHVLSLWQAFASWDAPFICYFSSRAPPQ